MKLLSDLFKMFLKDSEKYAKIKASNEQSVYFGVVSIVYSILGLVLGGAAVFFSIRILEGIGGSNNILTAIFMIIFGAALGIGGALGYLVYLIRGIVTASYQIKLPRKAIGVVSLIISLLIFIASIILIYFIIKKSL